MDSGLPENGEQWVRDPIKYNTPEELQSAAARVPGRYGVEQNTWGIALVRREDKVGVGFWRNPEWKPGKRVTA